MNTPSQQLEAKPKPRWRPTRRGFLIGTGAFGALLAIGVPAGLPVARRRAFTVIDGPAREEAFFPLTSDPAAWFEVLDDSRIRLNLVKVEMGQGVHTSLAQIAIEDLGIAWNDLDVVQASSFSPVEDGGTTRSQSIQSLYKPLREAAASLHAMMRNAAAESLGVTPGKVELRDRAFVLADSRNNSRDDSPDTFANNAISLAEVAALPQVWEVPDDFEPTLKPQSEFEFIGQSYPRRDILAKVTGQAIYGYDVRVEGMLYGAVVRPPTLEATMKAVWPMDAREMPGVVDVVIDLEAQFAGVVAESRAQAYAAVDAMRIEWDEGKRWSQAEIDEIITAKISGGTSVQKAGNPHRVLRSNTTLTTEYRTPFAAHSTLEPQAALADVKADRATIWISDQSQQDTAADLAKLLGMTKDRVEVIPAYLGGGFGRKRGIDIAPEAARLSAAVGRPVHVGWNRTEDMRYGFFRPPTHSVISASLDEHGKISAWLHNLASSDVARPFFPSLLNAVLGTDIGAARGVPVRYDIPNLETLTHHMELPTPTGFWRGLGLLANTFAIESFMDELAAEAGQDPLAFRLAHMPETAWGRRMAAVLEAAAEKAGWGSALPEGHAHGIACSSDMDTVVAMVAEISLDEETHQIRVHKMTCANDCGITITPDGAIAQIQGCIMWGIGSALIEEMQVNNGSVAITNFGEYPLLTAGQAPDVETILLESGDGIPRGMGEPPMGPPAAAIGNAFYTLTGVRLRQLPMTPERIRTAMA